MERFITKKNAIIFILVLVFGLVFNWVFSRGFIEVQTANQAGTNETTYTIIDQRTGERSETKTKTGKLRKLVRKGSYEILVRQGEASFLSVKKTSGFLGTTQLNATLTKEKARAFVGNNPDPCMYLVGGILASTQCGATVDELKVHMPATATRATYTQTAVGPAADLEAVLPAGTGALAIIHAEAEGDTGSNFHALYSLSGSGQLSLTPSRLLDDLGSDKQYTFQPYSKGYLAVSNDGSHMLYYASFDQKPSQVSIDEPSDDTLQYLSTSAAGDVLVALFSNVGRSELPNFSSPEGVQSHSEELESESKRGKSEIVVYAAGKTQRINIKQSVVQATPCGQNRLCILLASGKLEVYLIGDGKQDLLFGMTGVLDVQNISNQVRVVTSDGVFHMDLQKQEGFMVYSFGEYSFCGANKQTNSIIICVADEAGNRRALSLRMDKDNTDSIDEKVAGLGKIPEVKSVSPYGSFIHVSPELGELDFRESTGGFGYDPIVIRSTANAIDAEVKRLGIDTAKYTVVNPYR